MLLPNLKRELPGAWLALDTPVDLNRPRPRRNVLIPTVYGQMMVNRFDVTDSLVGVGGWLLASGQFDLEEMVLLRNIVATLPDKAVILDVGANIGVNTLVMAYESASHGGQVHAFEPQRQIFHMLCGNIALNSLDNVHCYHRAVGREAGRIPIPKLDYNRNASFGSLEFGQPQQEAIGQLPSTDAPGNEMVDLVAIDDLGFERIDFIKMDVEGMEIFALEGARKSLERFKPILHIEWIKSDVQALGAFLEGLGYEILQVESNLLAWPAGWQPAAGAGAKPSQPQHNRQIMPGSPESMRPGLGFWASLRTALKHAEKTFRHSRKGRP